MTEMKEDTVWKRLERCLVRFLLITSNRGHDGLVGVSRIAWLMCTWGYFDNLDLAARKWARVLSSI